MCSEWQSAIVRAACSRKTQEKMESSGSKVISPTQATPVTVYKKVNTNNCNESYSAATTNCGYSLLMAMLSTIPNSSWPYSQISFPLALKTWMEDEKLTCTWFPSIQSPLGVLSHSHPMWNISTWQVNFDLGTCCTVKQVIVINTEGETIVHGVCEIMSLWCHCFGLYCACAKESLSLFPMQHEVVQWLLSNLL